MVKCSSKKLAYSKTYRNANIELCREWTRSWHNRHPLNGVWSDMIQRCTNPNLKAYKHYGGRGITVCDRWRNSSSNFIADMGPRPPNHSLDRIDNNGNYEPDNCRWATQKEQIANRRPIHAI